MSRVTVRVVVGREDPTIRRNQPEALVLKINCLRVDTSEEVAAFALLDSNHVTSQGDGDEVIRDQVDDGVIGQRARTELVPSASAPLEGVVVRGPDKQRPVLRLGLADRFR